MQTPFSRLGAVRCLFFKSEQYQLIEMPVQVGASVDKRGHFTQAHTRIQKVRIEKPAQPDLFGNSEDPQKDKHSARLDVFINKHGGLGNLAHLMAGMTDGQQQRIFEEMGRLGGKSVVEVAAMFDNVKPEPAPQADLFAAPAPKTVESLNMAPESAVEYTTRKGKVIRGFILPGLSEKESKGIDEYSFIIKNEGWFIREKHLSALNSFLSKRGKYEAETRTLHEEHSVSNIQVLGGNASAVQRPEASELQELRSEGGDGLPGVAGELSGISGSRRGEARQELPGGQNREQQGVRAGERALGDNERAASQYDEERISDIQRQDDGNPRLGERNRNGASNNKLSDQGRLERGEDADSSTGGGDANQRRENSEAGKSGNDSDKVGSQAGDQKSNTSGQNTSWLDGRKDTDNTDQTEAGVEPFGVQAGISKQARRDLNAQAAAIVARGGEYSEADKAILRQYSGNGGCGDSLNEFYTLPEVASAMWSVAQRLGVNGDVLEPSCGPGVFLHTAPTGSKVTGVEMDETSAKIAKALHGDRHEVANASLERFATQDERQYDGVLGNVPFGLRGSLIKDDKPGLKTADAYFCDTSMDKCKAGGIVGLIVPTGVMDSRTNRKLREALLRKGQFLGAQRMPNTAFEHSHTEVTTDVVWFRKFPDDVSGALSTKAIAQEHLKSLGIWDDEFLAGNYFTGRGAENVLGKMGAGWRAKAGMGADITVEGSMKGVSEAIAEFQPEEEKAIPAVTAILDAVGTDEKARAVVLGGAMNRPYADKSKVGDTKTVDGIAYVLQGKPPRWHSIDEVLQSEALTQGQEIAGRIDALMAGMTAVNRPELEADLRAWVEAHGIPSKNKDVLLGAQQDKALYRLIGAVKSDGTLSDAVLGNVAQQQQGSFEATIRGLLNDHETVGVDELAKAAGVDSEEATDQLYGSPKYAIDPATGEWTTKDIYLTGDLWAKSDEVKAALAGEGLAPELRKKLEQQDMMLTETIAPVSLEDAFIQVNSAFLPMTMLSAFLTARNRDSGNKYQEDLASVEVTFDEGVYAITGGNKWSHSDLDKYLNRTGLKKDDKHIIDDLNVAFKDWLCASPEYREIAENLYNRKFRGFQEREFSNEPMDIPGMNTEGLKDYQWGGLRWALNAGKGIVAADVGLGKTARALMLARVLKTTGQAKRPMIVVPKSVLANWVAECEKWFPGSSVLTIGGAGDGPAERKRKYHDLQQNDYDFILISEPSFTEIDLDPTTKGEMNSKDFWVQRGDKLGNAGDKRTNQIRTAWEQARAGQEFGADDRTDATYFNQLGVDALIHDEFHHMKNLCSIKSRFGEQPKFMGGGGLSMRALDFNLKARWLLDAQGGKNVYGLTATPTKNSPIEIYAMLSHVAPEALEKVGIRNSEEFIDRFARIEEGLYQNTQGAMEEGQIVAGFHNMDELRSIMTRYIHRQTAEEVGLQLPERQDMPHLIDMDDAQQAKYSELCDLAAESGGKDATGDNHIFSIMDKMNKAAMDMSMLDSSYDGTKSPKYVACASEIIKGMKDGGQIVFSDYVDSHEKMAAALVAAGIPRNQIGIINAQVAPTSEKRQKICDAFNAGKLKVVIGNTPTMGEGLNLQKGTSDIHHLDLPWEPASMQQRNGRGLRQGNTNKGVRIHNYLAKGSFDGYRLQAILAKKDWQDAVWNGGNEVENLNKAGNISREEMAIMLSADPDQARAKFEANTKGKEERLIAGKTMEASQRFGKFQELKRSYAALKSRDNQSAARLKAKMDKEYSSLKADKYFTAKQALDLDTPVIVAPSGAVLHAGAGIDITDDDKAARYVITAVNPRGQTVTIRQYGDEKQAKREVDVKELTGLKPFAYDEKAETEEISRKIAERPIELKNISDAMKLPPAVIAANHAAIQKQMWDGVKSYAISAQGNKVALVERATGNPVLAESYEVGGNSDKFSHETHDFMLPTAENKAKIRQAWMDAERDASFGTNYSTTGNRRNQKSVTTAARHYGSSTQTKNPWNDALNELHEDKKYYGYESDSPTIKAAKAELQSKQVERVRHAKTFPDALDAAAPSGVIMESQKGHGAWVKLPHKVIATLWAKARHEGVLGSLMGMQEPKKESHGYKSNKHSQYYSSSAGNRSVHSALLAMAAAGGYDDLIHAMTEAGLRHHPDGKHDEALQAISQGHAHNPHQVLAMQKLAGAAGMLDKKRGELGDGYGGLNVPYYGGSGRDQTVGDKLAEMLADSQLKEAA